MQKINTNTISPIVVEIDGIEYPVAAKTIAVANALMAAQESCKGMMQYHLWLAELRVLLGTNVTEKLFANGEDENIDRIHRIHAGVVNAFEYHAIQTETQILETRSKLIESLMGFLSGVSEKMNKIAGMEQQA